MNAADVVVLPYRDILTSGNALLAMSFGRPVIIPRLGCVMELLDDRGAFLYDSGDPGALEAAMRHALDADLAAMGAHNYRLATAYDWQGIAGQTDRVYRECACRRGR